MRNLKSLASVLLVAALALIPLSAAHAGNSVLWSPSKGDLNFPISPPTTNPAAAGAIDNMTIGATTPKSIVGSTLQVDNGTRTATASSGAATLNKASGVITSEALTTAAGATYTLTLTDSKIAAADVVMASVNLGAGTGGTPVVASVKPAAGSVVIIIQNIHATAAFNAAIKIAFVDLK